MSSIISRICDDVAALVNAMEFRGEVLASKVDFAPCLDIARVRTRKIIVSPQSYTRTNASRSESASGARINIAVCEKITPDQIPEKLELVEAVARGLERKILAGSGAIVTGVEFDPVYDANSLRANGVFLSICVVTVKVLK